MLAAVTVVGGYLLLPPYFEGRVAASLEDQYATKGTPGVELYRSPSSLLSRSYDGGEIVLTAGDFGDVRPDRVTVELDPFRVELIRSLTAGRVSTARPISGSLLAEVSEDELSRVAREGDTAGGGNFPVLGVNLEEGQAVVESEVAFLGQTVPTTARGRMGVQNGALTFEPGRIEAMGVEVPPRLSDRTLRGTSFEYPIEDLPPGVEIGGAEVRGNTLLLTGRVQGLRV